MKLVIQRSDYDLKLQVLLEIEGHEYSRAKLTAFDRLLLDDCEGSDKASDKLLALETIVRRIEEATDVASTRTKE
jgi:hypothetical protein